MAPAGRIARFIFNYFSPVLGEARQGEVPAEPIPREKAPRERRPTGLT